MPPTAYRYPVIGVVGNGTVGAAVAASYRPFTDVLVYDRDPARSTHLLRDVLSAGVVFVCLPTPREPGTLRCDTSALDEFLGSVRINGGTDNTNIVIRSTVPVGYTLRASLNHALPNLVHSPEFLTARTADEDAASPRLNVIGAVNPGAKAPHLLLDLYAARFPDADVFKTSSDTSEALKLVMNSFFATKVAFFNEVRLYCDRLGIDYPTLRAALVAEGRVHPLHTEVPGPDGKRGFGGACLPKDLANLIDCLETAGLSAPVMRAAMSRNEFDRGNG